MATRRARGVVTVVVVLAVVVGVALAVRAVWPSAKARFTADSCTIGTYDLDPSQASVAATMIGQVTQYRPALPYRAGVLVLMAGLQESKLTNLAPGDGDRDSVGVLQQRPSQGWGGGLAAPLTDVGEATREFLDALVKVQGWRTMTPADAIQAVQISADGSAYAKHEPEARTLVPALQGGRAAGITCSFAAPTEVATPRQVAALARTELGIDTPTAVAHAVRVPGAHWQTAAWFVANADRLGIEQVAYAGRRWTRTGGWQRAKVPASAVTATMYRLPPGN